MQPPPAAPNPAPASRIVITADEARAVPQSALQRPELRQQIAPSGEPWSGKAIASLVFGIMGLPMMGILVGWFAIWFGIMALRQLDESPRLRGRNAANAGLILGIVDIVGWTIPIAIYIHRV